MIAAFYISIPCSYQMNEITKTFKHFFFQRSSDWDKLPPVHKENENYESWTVIHLYGSMSYICLWCWCMWMICFYWSLFILIVYSLALCFMCLLNQLFFFSMFITYLHTHNTHAHTSTINPNRMADWVSWQFMILEIWGRYYTGTQVSYITTCVHLPCCSGLKACSNR